MQETCLSDLSPSVSFKAILKVLQAVGIIRRGEARYKP
jgi:hypothetical protein